ncbi:MAG: hypothetical protein F6K11_06865 [Leptolyngbya sp. SIO3F4]|nr:hypothetical protein [Leptolyngbya sp. SIO3F4]
MDDSSAILEQAVIAQRDRSAGLPIAKDLVTALLATEKSARTGHPFAAMAGTWRLCFITGTKKTRQKAGVALGAGRYLPKLIKIQLAYQVVEDNHGLVQNSVGLGQLKLQLTGPIRFWPKARCLAFDFTQIQIALGGLTLYQGRIKPETADQEFYQQPLKEQAFFKYFWVTETGIAARGRGGGLALWYRENS